MLLESPFLGNIMELQVYTDEPVSRTVNGLEQYAHRIIGVLDPPADELLWLNEGDVIPPLFEAYTMRMTTKGTRTGEGSGSWGTCFTCRYDFPIASMVYKNGKYYCTKEKCADDL